MQIILTHEQADFDAIGSLLGAHLLNEQALAVLPRRMNRNVQAFVTLYGAKLPFIEARDLPAGSIQTITLVDTQSLITLRGTGHHTRVQVIDHHQERENLSPHWTVKTDQTGACTTLFVEELRERHESVSTIQATLMLIGIYEDTGSMTYGSTTPRDLGAAAYLLGQGASLRVASEYLNPPLSPEQRLLYDQLLAAAEEYTINGQKIVITCAEVDEQLERPHLDARTGKEYKGTDEISSVTHKLRDLLDLDALFVLVNTHEGVRMVARSTTGKVNVAQVANHFGGGGHERAAAALIKSDQLPVGENEQPPLSLLKQELICILPQHVQPAITVGQIMSRQPMLLAPETSAQEAAQLMQRFGYEGYPVVKDGRVVGLLTRRAVDRALSHKLDLSAASLMDSGEIFIAPQDSLDQLRQMMIDSGWGQIPVVETTHSEIVGIVTRTDLLDTLTNGEARSSGPQNLSTQLEMVLPPARLALLKLIADQASQQHLGIYIVGGFVRDLLLDCASPDFDLVVEGDAIALGNALSERYGGRVVSHSRFGTAKWQIGEVRRRIGKALPSQKGLDWNDLPASIDLISARTEFYEYPTALPTVRSSSIKLDLHRRDFTINTMAVRLDGRYFGDLYDYWGGLSDLRRRLVRVLHSLSFIDDPTRLLRAVRFEQRFEFDIEIRTNELIGEARPIVRQVSGERLRHELDLIFAEKHPATMLARLQSLDLLSAIHPALNWPDELTAPLECAINQAPPPGWELPDTFGHLPIRRTMGYLVWLLRVPTPLIEGIANRLRFPAQLIHTLIQANRLWQELPSLARATPGDIVAHLDDVPMPALYALYCLNGRGKIAQILHHYTTEWQHVQPATTGHTLREHKIKPGPAYREILSYLRGAWLNRQINNPDEETALLEELLKKYSS